MAKKRRVLLYSLIIFISAVILLLLWPSYSTRHFQIQREADELARKGSTSQIREFMKEGSLEKVHGYRVLAGRGSRGYDVIIEELKTEQDPTECLVGLDGVYEKTVGPFNESLPEVVEILLPRLNGGNKRIAGGVSGFLAAAGDEHTIAQLEKAIDNGKLSKEATATVRKIIVEIRKKLSNRRDSDARK